MYASLFVLTLSYLTFKLKPGEPAEALQGKQRKEIKI
jgi:hypothetical protein